MLDKSNTVIVVGATGLIGRRLVKQLKIGGYLPLVLTRNSLKAKKVFGEDVDIHEWDGSDVFKLAEIISSAKAIINLSGESIAKRWTERNRKLIFNSRVDITISIVKAINACEVPPKLFVQASATGFYPHNSDELFNEDSYAGAGFLSSLVSAWEQASNSIDSKVRRVIIRTGVVLSPGGGFLKEVLPSIRNYIGGWFGSGKQKVSWIHIDDHVKAICFLLANSDCYGHYNLVSPNPIEMKLLLKKVGEMIKRPVWVPIPAFIMKLAFGQMANEVLLANQAVTPKRLTDAGFKFQYEDIDKALRNLLC